MNYFKWTEKTVIKRDEQEMMSVCGGEKETDKE